MKLNLSHFLPWNKSEQIYLKNFLFGVEDSLVSTVGLLSGIAAASVSRTSIVTTGLILIVVEGFAMGIGSFLTEETTNEMFNKKVGSGMAIKGALTMLFSYILAGLIPLFPYMIWDSKIATLISICVALIGLFILGYGTAAYFKRPSPISRALKMFFLGGIAVIVGIAIGKIFHL